MIFFTNLLAVVVQLATLGVSLTWRVWEINRAPAKIIFLRLRMFAIILLLLYMLKLGLPEQAVGWFPLRFGLVVEDKPTEFSRMYSQI